MDVIKTPRRRKPFNVIPVTQSLILNFSVNLAPFFKNVLKSTTKSALNIQKARVLDYSTEHVDEVWVKYTSSDKEEWSKFRPLKASAVPHLPAIDMVKYAQKIPVKANKVADIMKIVEKYVPEQHQTYYRSLLSTTSDTETETDESDD